MDTLIFGTSYNAWIIYLEKVMSWKNTHFFLTSFTLIYILSNYTSYVNDIDIAGNKLHIYNLWLKFILTDHIIQIMYIKCILHMESTHTYIIIVWTVIKIKY